MHNIAQEFYQLTRDEPNKDGHIQTHEAEFRCYIMLLNIKDADCIRLVALDCFHYFDVL